MLDLLEEWELLAANTRFQKHLCPKQIAEKMILYLFIFIFQILAFHLEDDSYLLVTIIPLNFVIREFVNSQRLTWCWAPWLLMSFRPDNH